MDDAALATRAIDGDQGAWAEIYDAYADRLHDYCYSIVRDRHEAADVLHDAFVTAASKIGQLRDPGRLRPWLYAICRTESLAAIRRRTREAPAEKVPDVADRTVGGDGAAQYAETELRELVSAAAGGLEARDRSVLFLHLRGGLEGRDLGEALGVSAHHATVLLGRVRGHVERSLAALLVGRTGRGECTELDGLLSDWDGTLSPLIRKRVARHIDSCKVCGERRKRMVSPFALLSAVPIVPAPDDLRQRTLDDIALVATRRPLGGGFWGSRAKLWAAAAAVVALLIAGGILAFLPEPSTPQVAASAADPTAPVTATGTSTSTSKASGTPRSGTSKASTPASASQPAPSTAVTPTTTATTTRRPAANPGTGPEPPPPVISGLSTDRDSLSPGTSCSATTATATVTGTDVTRVVLVWQQGSAAPQSMEMSPDAGDTYTGRIGPITTGDEVTWHVRATDAASNSTTGPDRTIPVRSTC